MRPTKKVLNPITGAESPVIDLVDRVEQLSMELYSSIKETKRRLDPVESMLQELVTLVKAGYRVTETPEVHGREEEISSEQNHQTDDQEVKTIEEEDSKPVTESIKATESRQESCKQKEDESILAKENQSLGKEETPLDTPTQVTQSDSSLMLIGDVEKDPEQLVDGENACQVFDVMSLGTKLVKHRRKKTFTKTWRFKFKHIVDSIENRTRQIVKFEQTTIREITFGTTKKKARWVRHVLRGLKHVFCGDGQFKVKHIWEEGNIFVFWGPGLVTMPNQCVLHTLCQWKEALIQWLLQVLFHLLPSKMLFGQRILPVLHPLVLQDRDDLQTEVEGQLFFTKEDAFSILTKRTLLHVPVQQRQKQRQCYKTWMFKYKHRPQWKPWTEKQHLHLQEAHAFVTRHEAYAFVLSRAVGTWECREFERQKELVTLMKARYRPEVQGREEEILSEQNHQTDDQKVKTIEEENSKPVTESSIQESEADYEMESMSHVSTQIEASPYKVCVSDLQPSRRVSHESRDVLVEFTYVFMKNNRLMSEVSGYIFDDFRSVLGVDDGAGNCETSTYAIAKLFAHQLFDILPHRGNKKAFQEENELMQQTVSLGHKKDELMKTKSLELSDLSLGHKSQKYIVSFLATDHVLQPQKMESSSGEVLQMATWICSTGSLDRFQSQHCVVFADLPSGFKSYGWFGLQEDQSHQLHVDEVVELTYPSPTASAKNKASMVVYMSSKAEQMRTKRKQGKFLKSWRFKFKTEPLVRVVQKSLIAFAFKTKTHPRKLTKDKFWFKESKDVSIDTVDVAQTHKIVDVPLVKSDQKHMLLEVIGQSSRIWGPGLSPFQGWSFTETSVRGRVFME
ncbi:unnamed protein product [Arabis nemorensis]|uniref:Uncharacterized protein n=1 Tax=Arabis nemorensis TaxID=586526 RepID=A0A565BQX3_9BRAS|nr:unnamed protein product [Arabis nemorensis]